VNQRVSTRELDGDGCPAEIGAHGEVGDSGGPGDSGGDVEEDTIGTRLHGRCGDDTKRCDSHDGADGEVEIGAMAGDSDGDRFVVDNVGVHVNSVVNHGCGIQRRTWMLEVSSFLEWRV